MEGRALRSMPIELEVCDDDDAFGVMLPDTDLS
jgi:hypothetical protein